MTTPPTTTTPWTISSTDPHAWAKEFQRRQLGPEQLEVWFKNAMHAARSDAARSVAELTKLQAETANDAMKLRNEVATLTDPLDPSSRLDTATAEIGMVPPGLLAYLRIRRDRVAVVAGGGGAAEEVRALTTWINELSKADVEALRLARLLERLDTATDQYRPTDDFGQFVMAVISAAKDPKAPVPGLLSDIPMDEAPAAASDVTP